MKWTICIFLLTLGYLNLAAQLPTYEEAVQVKNSTLVVAVNSGHKGQKLKSLIEKHWTYTSDFKFLPVDEAFEYWKKNNESAVIFRHGTKEIGYKLRQNKTSTSVLVTNVHIKDVHQMVVYTRMLPLSGYERAVDLYMENLHFDEADIVFGIKVMNYMLNYRLEHPEVRTSTWRKELKKTDITLEGITLLVKVEHKEEFLKLFSDLKCDNIQYVDDEEIRDVILNEKEGYAYFKKLPTAAPANAFYVIDAVDGEILLRVVHGSRIHKPRF